MSEPIEMQKGTDRKTVHSDIRAAVLEEQGWVRVRNLTPGQQQELASKPGVPWRDYENMTVDEVRAYAADLDDNRRQEALQYELATKQRKGVIEALGGTVDEPAPDAPADEPAALRDKAIAPANDVPAATGQGRLARKGATPKGSTEG